MVEIMPKRPFVIIDHIIVRSEQEYGPMFKGVKGFFRRLWWRLTGKPKTRATEARFMVNEEPVHTLKNLWLYDTSILPLDPPLVFDLDDAMRIDISPPDAYYVPVIKIHLKSSGFDLRRNP